MTTRRRFLQQGLVTAGALMGDQLFASSFNIAGKAFPKFSVLVTAEEVIYQYLPANNGAGPMWANGLTTVVRVGKQVFASGLETVPEIKGLSKCRWMLFKRYDSGWMLEAKDLINLNREPCPIAVLNSREILLSVNPKQADACTEYCLTHPEILRFNVENPQVSYTRLIPVWAKNPGFMDHSYRALAIDRSQQELILFHNYMYQHAEWSFLSGTGKWSANGALQWPSDSYNGKEVPLRLCYSNVALKDKRVFFFSTADVVEPNEAWRTYKKQLTGANWDYVFRRLFFSWSDDITSGKFHPWIEIANLDLTAGYVRNQDLWLDAGGDAHLLWLESRLDERLRKEFFPDQKQKHSLCYAIFKGGKMLVKSDLLTYNEGESDAVFATGNARFHALPGGRLFVLYYAAGTSADGGVIAENRIMEVFRDGSSSKPVVVPLKQPFTSFQTANENAGCMPGEYLDIIGVQQGKENTISYGQVKIA